MSNQKFDNRKPEPSMFALIPVGIFLVTYLGLGIVLEYILKIEMGFYQIPIVVAFMIAIFVACIQNRQESFDKKLFLMAQGVGDKNIITMILIFLTAGIFVGVTGRDSAEAVAYFMLSITPAKGAIVILFVVACFVSLAMGTSCGTISLLVPIGIAVSDSAGFSVPLCVGAVMSGAMFGDNLSFISDTTIAACNTQGCEMKDKFRANFSIALPAAIITLMILFVVSMQTQASAVVTQDYNMILLIPYVLVLFGGILGFNVFIVLLVGIISGLAITLITGTCAPLDVLANMGSGVSGMYETILVTILVSAMCGIIRYNGGFEALLQMTRRICKSRRAGRFGIGLMVAIMDIATANNTVAIVMAGPIAKDISTEYGIMPKRAASILDIFSCVVQCLIPYGAQMLLAISASSVLGKSISAFEIIPYLYYPFVLLVVAVIFLWGSDPGKNK